MNSISRKSKHELVVSTLFFRPAGSDTNVFSGPDFGDLDFEARMICAWFFKNSKSGVLNNFTHLHLPNDNRFELIEFAFGGEAWVLGAGHVATLDCQHDGVHQVLGSLDQRSGRVQARDDQLARHVLNVRFHLRDKWNVLVTSTKTCRRALQALFLCNIAWFLGQF